MPHRGQAARLFESAHRRVLSEHLASLDMVLATGMTGGLRASHTWLEGLVRAGREAFRCAHPSAGPDHPWLRVGSTIRTRRLDRPIPEWFTRGRAPNRPLHQQLWAIARKDVP